MCRLLSLISFFLGVGRKVTTAAPICVADRGEHSELRDLTLELMHNHTLARTATGSDGLNPARFERVFRDRRILLLGDSTTRMLSMTLMGYAFTVVNNRSLAEGAAGMNSERALRFLQQECPPAGGNRTGRCAYFMTGIFCDKLDPVCDMATKYYPSLNLTVQYYAEPMDVKGALKLFPDPVDYIVYQGRGLHLLHMWPENVMEWDKAGAPARLLNYEAMLTRSVGELLERSPKAEVVFRTTNHKLDKPATGCWKCQDEEMDRIKDPRAAYEEYDAHCGDGASKTDRCLLYVKSTVAAVDDEQTKCNLEGSTHREALHQRCANYSYAYCQHYVDRTFAAVTGPELSEDKNNLAGGNPAHSWRCEETQLTTKGSTALRERETRIAAELKQRHPGQISVLDAYCTTSACDEDGFDLPFGKDDWYDEAPPPAAGRIHTITGCARDGIHYGSMELLHLRLLLDALDST